MKDTYFKTEGLTVGYDGQPLIKDIGINIERGQIFTLIGPNGSGKSTILKSITKHLKTIAGTVYIDNKMLDSFSYKELSTKVAVVLTERMKPELMTCYEVVATGRYPYTGRLGILTKEDEDKVIEAMELVKAKEIGDRLFTAISDGQRQRILLARAICQEPDIIVLDEPTSFLDIKHKIGLLNILRDMAKNKGITIIMSLHEIDLAQKISDVVMCVKGDCIKNCGMPKEIFKEELIKDLYEIDGGSFNVDLGSVELKKPQGEPEVFVIAGGGKGIDTFRDLQKLGIPFYTGILNDNDIDYVVAKSLSNKVFSEEAFEPISDKVLNETLMAVKKCKFVIDTGIKIGSVNKKMEILLNEAKTSDKLYYKDNAIEILTNKKY